jgi:hypothetical protein
VDSAHKDEEYNSLKDVWYFRKSLFVLMTKHLLLFILSFCTIAKADAQKKFWEAIAFADHSKTKGVLKEVNDSSLVLLTKGGEQTLLFNNLSRLKFVRTKNRAIKVIAGSIVGATLGAAITANQLTKGRAGEPGALSGVVGGIGGGILGGIVGALTAPLLCEFLFARKINIKHTTIFYQSLRQKLQTYIAK